ARVVCLGSERLPAGNRAEVALVPGRPREACCPCKPFKIERLCEGGQDIPPRGLAVQVDWGDPVTGCSASWRVIGSFVALEVIRTDGVGVSRRYYSRGHAAIDDQHLAGDVRGRVA